LRYLKSLRNFNLMNPITKLMLYTGHSAVWITVLVVVGTTLGLAATEIVTPIFIEPNATSSDYIIMLIKTVPALSVLGGVVYLFVKYLEARDRGLAKRNEEIEVLLERTINALTDNSKAISDMQMDIRRNKSN